MNLADISRMSVGERIVSQGAPRESTKYFGLIALSIRDVALFIRFVLVILGRTKHVPSLQPRSEEVVTPLPNHSQIISQRLTPPNPSEDREEITLDGLPVDVPDCERLREYRIIYLSAFSREIRSALVVKPTT